MHIIYINKNIILENIINSINLINIEDNVQYLNRSDGILIKGYIDIECEYLSYGVIKYFKDKADVSLLIPYENLNSNELLFKIEDFDYLIKDNSLSLSFKINIEGYKEIEKSFQDENKEVEIVSNVDVELEDIEKYLQVDEELVILNQDDVSDELKEKININKDLIINDNKISDTELEEIKSELDNNLNYDNNNFDDGKRMEFNISGEESIKYIDTKIKMETPKSFVDSLFKKEKKVKTMKYRVILENDTYEDIAKEYNINLFKLKEINNNKSLELGKIIKIPSRHE